MAVLARVNWVAQQRVDLNHILAQESFLAFDFRSLLTGLSGTVNPYILRGYEVVGKTGLTISIVVQKSLVFNPLDGNGSFFAGGDNDDDILVDLPADQENIFVQARFRNETRAPVNTAFWDALALTGEDVAGTEFTASTNTQNVIVLEIEANTVGFNEDAIPILRASTSASAVTEMIDARRMLYRLGTGGPTPNPLNKFPWSNTRQESVATGTGVGDETDSPFRSSDTTGVRNDKGIGSLKEWMDAVMTRISEIAGQALWYDNSSASSATSGLTLNTLFIDTIGHSLQPDADVSLIWSRVSGSLKLQSQGPASVKWQFNYGALQWEVGGTFVSNVAGGSRAYSLVRFTSPAPVDNGNLYLLLEREVPKGSGSAVIWANNSADPNLLEPRAISGVTGDFVGIAIGDYIRKESEGIQRYYKIVKMSDGTTITTTADYIADSTIVALEVDRDIDSGVTAEPLRYWRAKYSNDDLVADTISGQYTHQDLSFYWLGRRRGTLFHLRDFGTMQEGEEVTIINDAFQIGSGGQGDLMLEHGYNTVYDATLGYSQAGGAGFMLTIRRRKRDNTVDTPSSGDNSGAYLTYTLSTPVGLMAVGDTLWVKLDDDAGGALSAGSVDENTADDQDNTDTVTNVWEVLSAANTPLRNYDNRDVYPIARRINITTPAGTESALVFLDGTIIAQNGTYINNRFATTGVTRFYNDNVYLMTRSAQAVLFIDETDTGRINEDVANFFYDQPNGILGVQNYRIGLNTITLDTPADQDWLPNLGAHTLDIGGSSSTVRIRGDLLVLGATVSSQVSTIQSDDKLVTLGVGNLSSASGGSGFEVADNTVEVVSVDALNTIAYLDLNYGSSHGYTLGQDVGVSSNTDIRGITAGQITGSYRVVTTASSPGEAQVMSATKLRIWTLGAATSSGNTVLSPPSTSIRTFDVLSWQKMTDKTGDVSGMTSWSYKVKGLTQVVTMTPVTNYGIIPTAHSTNMVANRIPFVNNDNSGPVDDSTINFSGNLTWDNGTNTFGVIGTINLTGNLIPGADNTYDIGTTALRWKTLHVGPGSIVVHNDTTNTLKVQLRFNGALASLDTDNATSMNVSALQTFLQSAGTTVATVRSNLAFALTPTSTPGSAASGDLYFDSTTQKLRNHDGTGWLDVDRADIAGEITGYADRTASTFGFVNGTRTFTISPTGANYDYYIRGQRFRISTSKTVVLPNVTGLYFIYFDTSSTLQSTTSFSVALLQSFAYTATVYWNATTGEGEFLSEERHGLTMDGETHAYLHLTQGTKYVSGLTLTPNASLGGDGSTNAQAQVVMTGGTIRDEDISITIVDAAVPANFFEQILSPTAQIPVAYRIGASGDWQRDNATLFPIKAGVARPRWNQFTGGAWQLTDTTANGNFIAQWIFATNDVSQPIVSILGQDEYTSLSDAQARANYELLSFGILPFQEFKLLFRVLYRTDATYTNTIKAAAYYITDYRKSTDISLSSSYMPSDHGSLGGLGDDDHPQYLLLAGRTGGQTATGGIASGNNLILRSTSNATKGQVWVDETTVSTSSTTGAFRVTGGVGIGGDFWGGGQVVAVGDLRARNAVRFEQQRTVTTTQALTTNDCIVRVNTSANVADITLTLPAAVAGNAGQMIILKDIGNQLSYFNKRLNLAPNGTDTIDGSNSTILLDIDGMSVTLIATGTGTWIMI